MEMVRIHRLSARYHLPPSREEERERLDRILRTVLDEALEGALERAGVSPYEEVCIRSLHVPVRLRLSLANSSLALAWSLALSDSIVRARNGEYVPNVVRYHSAAHVLFDVAIGVATDRFERAWAWRLARAWRGSESPSASEATAELVYALLEEPALIAPLLAALAARNVPAAVFAGLWRRVSAAQWVELARAALHAAGVSASIIEDAAAPGIAEVVRQAQRMLAASALARAAASAPEVLMNALETRRAFAALIALELDPAVARPFARARALVSALSDAMHPATFRAPLAPLPHSRDKEREPQALLNDDVPAAVTRRAFTNFGGLLFLLRLIEELGLPDEILGRCAQRPFRWALHQLALALVPAEAEDPAALAFAGLLPNAVPPTRDEEPPTDVEREIIASFVERIQAALEKLLEEKQPIALVCHRAAEIVADPGWIEVRLSLNDVSTAIRRTGLDLDPGNVPWLGVVVRFVYE
ncbi:MAG: hypothetical protein M3461_13090 [Pseudomonadota bacterium]|nr:hypothetical protein [Pseudomonadota bacterium]